MKVRFIGCAPNYFPECGDDSDKFICQASKCAGNNFYFPCFDRKYCIPKDLVCDGYAQCEDGSGIFQSSQFPYYVYLSIFERYQEVIGPYVSTISFLLGRCLILYLLLFVLQIDTYSDESTHLCGRCPMEGGVQFPRNFEMLRLLHLISTSWVALSEYSATATFLCKHNVTKRPICAVPCNGVTEMCEYDADEQCQGTSLVIVLFFTFMLATTFMGVEFLTRKFIPSSMEMPQNVTLEMYQLQQSNENGIVIFNARLLFYKSRLNFEKSIELAGRFYNEKSLAMDGVDKFFMNGMGTNGQTAFFYDCINMSIVIRIGLYLQLHIPNFLKVWKERKCQDIFEVIKCIASLWIRYSDLPKDILFLYLIWVQLGNHSTGSFPIVIFWTLLTSIAGCEILHCVTIMMYYSRDNRRKALTLLLTPFMPAFFMCKKLQLKLELAKLLRKCDKLQQVQNEEIQKYEIKCCQLQLMTAKLQCTENILENLTLFAILTLAISLSHTTSRAVENIDNIFVKDNQLLGYALAFMSFLSIIRGQVSFLKANKNGCLGIKGTFLVIPFFVLGTCSRYSCLRLNKMVNPYNGPAAKLLTPPTLTLVKMTITTWCSNQPHLKLPRH